MIEKFELTGLADRLPDNFPVSGSKRVALARIMAYEPDVILLDEPFFRIGRIFERPASAGTDRDAEGL